MKTNIKMALEAGIRDCVCNGTMGCLKRFAELVRAEAQAEEREACAEVAEMTPCQFDDYKRIAAAIRARSNT